MSLVGNLEDLGFGDILQIVSLSRKSGVLLIQRDSDRAKIIFGNGQVLAAFTSTDRQDLCAPLLERRIVTAGLVAQAQARHRDSGGRASLAECLVAAGASAARVQEAARGEIERVVLGLFRWTEGDFSFEHRDVEQDLARVRAHAQRVVCESGINPQFLAIEASRIADESGRGPAAAPGESPARPDEAGAPDPEGDVGSIYEAAVAGVDPSPPIAGTAPAPLAAPAAVSGRKVVLVDDDERFLALLVPVIEGWGFETEAFPGGGPAAERIEALARDGQIFAVVSDLLMPRVDGGGLLGGLELLERVRNRFATLPFVLVTDHLHEEAEARARALDVDFTLAKPRSAQLSGGPGSAALQEFIGALGPILRSFAPPAETAPPHRAPAAAAQAPDALIGATPPYPPAEETIDIGLALREAADPGAGLLPPMRTAMSALETLKSMLVELSNPGASDEVTLLVLRFAAEVMNRGVLFMVKGREAIGLGGFGFDVTPGAAASGPRPAFARGSELRRIRVPLDAPSILHDVVAKRSVLRGPLEASEGNAILIEAMGGAEPRRGFAAPMCVGEKVIAVLYGDNAPEDRPVSETEALEIFLTQAGLALEKAMLERRLREMRGHA